MSATILATEPQGASAVRKAILTAWAVAGTLDMSDAVVWTLMHGKSPAQMLQRIASALLGKAAADGGLAAAAFGLALHYSIMLVMVGVFVLAATRLPTLTRRPVLWGLLYGLGLYVVMNWIVLPLRWPETFGTARPMSVANQVFANLILVGLPISLITARRLRPPVIASVPCVAP